MDNFFRNCNILITGATGFVGLALIEKLLRCFPDVGVIYLLMRPKRDSDIHARLVELKRNKVFDRLRKDFGDSIFNKLLAINGDVNDENMGLSLQNRQLIIESVNIVYHCAATLDFEANLVTAVNTNLLGTRRLIQFSKEFKNLKVFLHISSAYVNSNITVAYEKLYDPPENIEYVIGLVNSLDVSAIDDLTPGLIQNHPNTYTFTKALAEHEVAGAHNSSFPTVIIRPSMILGAWKEPFPGWTISRNGPQGFLMGALKGVVRRLPINTSHIYDYIPVDVVINYMIVAAYSAHTNPTQKTPIYHVTSSTSNPFQWKTIESKVNSHLHEYPIKEALWYPALKFLPTLFLFQISAFFFHILPALALDSLTKVFGGRPKLLRLHGNIIRSLNRLAPFIFNQWLFSNDEALSLREILNDRDKENFYLDIDDLNWEEFFKCLVIGVRTYLHHETLDTLPSARRKDRILGILNVLLQIAILMVIWMLAAYLQGSSLLYSSWILIIILIANYIL